MGRPRAPISPDFLSKKGGAWRPVRLMDIVTLLHCVWAAKQHPDVGFEDASRTIEQMTRMLNKRILVDPSLLESTLWSCNLLDERGEFWDVRGRSFSTFLRELLGNERKFDRRYNVIIREEY
jgi:hypothetical protein